MFKMKYEIFKRYLSVPSKRRSGIRLNQVKFIVAHDTGNPESTAMNNINYYENSCNEFSASAHIFVDDTGIYECVPILTGTPEKAWHVLYNKSKDNQMFGDDANDAAAGIEYCYGSRINANEAYKRYVWVIAYTCYKFNLDPRKSIVGHCILDPERKTDPRSGLRASGRTYEQLLIDVVNEYEDCTKQDPVEQVVNKPKTPEKKGVCKVDDINTWQKQIGEKAIDQLFADGLITNSEAWKSKLGEHVPNWLFFELIRRVSEQNKK